jgi:hypothetical protein
VFVPPDALGKLSAVLASVPLTALSSKVPSVSSISGVQVDGASMATAASSGECDSGDRYKVPLIVVAVLLGVSLIALVVGLGATLAAARRGPRLSGVELSRKQIALAGSRGISESGSTRSHL